MDILKNSTNGDLVSIMADKIIEKKAYLSEIDGKIGDGDHGVNMAKGFSTFKNRSEGKNLALDESLQLLSDILMTEIGGSMGPLYGVMFENMADAISEKKEISSLDFSTMLNNGLEAIQEIGSAKVGDKTLIDTLQPAAISFQKSIDNGNDFKQALTIMKTSAEEGRDSTIDLVAKIGRSSRLGERSKGVLDAGATSCCLILSVFADNIPSRLE